MTGAFLLGVRGAMPAGQSGDVGAAKTAGTSPSGLAEDLGDAGASSFDRMVNGLNRLPRPLLAFGTIGLFLFAMMDPEGFGQRMAGLKAVPEPLWWLSGAVVAFYFGARESHYRRNRPPQGAPPAPLPEVDGNAALNDWREAAE